METGKLLLCVILVCLMSRRWRLHRRIFHQAFRQAEMPTYHALQLRCAHKMLFSLLQDPGNYPSHVKMSVATVFLVHY
jgi:cytochrome P450